MIVIDRKENCCGCMSCVNVCKKQCITMKTDEEGFYYPVIDIEQCVDCRLCELVCPINHIINNENKLICGYSAYVNSEEERFDSSSGGIFSAISKLIFRQNGIVVGAKFENPLKVKHDFAYDMKTLDLFRKSKYLQSDINDSYQKVLTFLNQDRYVLFSGTPCQIAGLKGYIGNRYFDKLITVDFICHGVPSPGLWEKYLHLRWKNQKVYKVDFRSKLTGWKNFSMAYYFNQKVIIDDKDLFMKTFLKNISLRPSCYECKFRGENRLSDITLADFWSVEKVLPGFCNDDKGVSLVLINSNTGRKIFDQIKDHCTYSSVNNLKEILKKYNKSYYISPKVPHTRQAFIKQQARDANNILKVMEKYTQKSFKDLFYDKIYMMAIKIKRKVDLYFRN